MSDGYEIDDIEFETDDISDDYTFGYELENDYDFNIEHDGWDINRGQDDDEDEDDDLEDDMDTDPPDDPPGGGGGGGGGADDDFNQSIDLFFFDENDLELTYGKDVDTPPNGGGHWGHYSGPGGGSGDDDDEEPMDEEDERLLGRKRPTIVDLIRQMFGG